MARTPKPWWRKDRQHWSVYINGKRHNLGADRELAFRKFHELMAQPQKRTIISADSLLAIMDAFLDWCQKHRAPDTYQWYRDRLERFGQTYPDMKVKDLRPFHVQQWMDSMEVSSGTKRNYGRSIKRCLRWAKKLGYIDANPIAEMELPKAGKREQVVSNTEWDTILDNIADQTLRDLLIVTWETGCRPQESLRVEARHVDLENQRWWFSVTESKTDIPRIVYLTDKALAITKRLMRQYPQGSLFRNIRGKPWTTDAVNCAFTRVQIKLGMDTLRGRCHLNHQDRRRQYLWVDDAEAEKFAATLKRKKQSGATKTDTELLTEARRKLAYADAKREGTKYSLYVLRHTWINRLLTRGVDALTVAFLAGHSDLSTLAKVYAHLSQNPSYLLEQAKKAAG